MTERLTRHPLLAKSVHAARVALVAALLIAIPSPADKSRSERIDAPSLDQIEIGNGDDRAGLRIESDQASGGLWPIVDADDKLRAWVARTLPEASDVLGYRGPTEAWIILDPNLKIVSVGLLGSADTQEHVDAVIDEPSFFRQFEGWSWGGPPRGFQIDAVSGATLTSLALAEGVLNRIGSAPPSLVFPDPLAVGEIQDWFPAAVSVDDLGGEVRDQKQQLIGRVLRTGPLNDDLIGYQGPTELLMKLSPDDQVESIRIRRSFDNQPYVDYVRVEAGFWKTFQGKTLGRLAQFVPEDEGIEGVSGATMTSLAVAETIVAAARAAEEASVLENEPPPQIWHSVRWTRADLATIAAILLAGLLSRLGWFHRRTPRRLWLLAVVLVIGLWSGNLISMALVAGWSAEGVAWKLAPGLAAIAAVTLLVPPLAKSNPYCNHLCPHGALQQLIKPGFRSRRRWSLSRRSGRWLRRLPGATLAVAYLALIAVPSIDLSAWEPFHAYLFRIAPWGSFALAALTLVIAASIPMGYCRFGCPTGRLIDYLRRTAVSDRLEFSDLVAAALLAIALIIRV